MNLNRLDQQNIDNTSIRVAHSEWLPIARKENPLFLYSSTIKMLACFLPFPHESTIIPMLSIFAILNSPAYYSVINFLKWPRQVELVIQSMTHFHF